MRINLIFARSSNGVIGRDNQLPWHLPEDLAHFRRWTQGCPVLMGRHTWDSLPPRFRPLPGRQNLVLTRDPAQALALSQAGAIPCASLDEALQHCQQSLPDANELWIIGGAQVYAQALPVAQRAVITDIGLTVDGDAYAPVLGEEWTEQQRESHVSGTGIPYDTVICVRATGQRQPAAA